MGDYNAYYINVKVKSLKNVFKSVVYTERNEKKSAYLGYFTTCNPITQDLYRNDTFCRKCFRKWHNL